jgi:D-proline reductase (dithiol) PrdB
MSELVVALLQHAQNDQHFQVELLQATPNELLALGLKPGQQAVLLSNLLLKNPSQSGNQPDWDARYGHAFPWIDFSTRQIPWTPFEISLRHAKIAFITTAGIYKCSDLPFNTQDEERGDPTYRVIPMETPPEALCVKHHLSLVEPGIDGDTNHLLPLQVARQLLQEGIIGALPAEHYSFMGYIPHTQPLLERTAPEVALRLRAEGVDAVILIPI